MQHAHGDRPTREECAAARTLLLRRATQDWMRRRGRPVQPELTPAVRRQYQEAFALLDSDGSGALDEAEVYQGFKALRLPTSRAAVRHMVAAMSEDGVGVTYNGFERLVAARKNEMTDGGTPPVPLEVMARSLRRAKLLNAVLLEREAAIAEYRARAAADADVRVVPVARVAADEELQPAPPCDSDTSPLPPGMEPEVGQASSEHEAPQAEVAAQPFPFRKQRRRSVLVCIGDLQKMVPFDMSNA